MSISLSNSIPAAPSGKQNITWQSDGEGHISGYISATAPGGISGDIQYNESGAFAGSGGLFTFNPTTELLFLDNSISIVGTGPALLIGDSTYGDLTATPISPGGILLEESNIEIHNNYAQGIYTFVHSNSANSAPILTFNRSEGTQASPNVVNAGDSLGYIEMLGYDGSGYTQALGIQTEATATWASNNHGNLTFFVIPHSIVGSLNNFNVLAFGNILQSNGGILDGLYVAGTFDVVSNLIVFGEPSGSGASSGFDTGLYRSAAGVLEVSLGTSGGGYLTGTGNALGTLAAAIVNAGTGFQVAGGAASGNYLRGNGTDFVSSAIQLADLPSSYPWSELGNAAANLTLSNAGYSTTFNQTSAVDWLWANTTAASQASPTLVASAATNVAGGASSAVNTTNATLLVAVCGGYGNGNAQVPSDSKNNQWTALSTYGSGTEAQVLIAYVQNPVVGTGHTFTAHGVDAAINVYAFSGAVLINVYDVSNGNSTKSGSGFQPGSITPNYYDILVTGACSNGVTVTASVNDSFSSVLQSPNDNDEVVISSYLLGASAGTPINPTFTTSANTDWVSAIAGFQIAVTDNNSPILQLAGTYWNGSASAADTWSIQDILSGSNSTLQISHSGASGTAAVNVPELLLGTGDTDLALTRAASATLGISGIMQTANGNSTTAAHSFTSNPTAGMYLSGTSVYLAGINDCYVELQEGGAGFIFNDGNVSSTLVSGVFSCHGLVAGSSVTSEGSGTCNVQTAYYLDGTIGITQTAEAVGTLATMGGIVTTFTAVSDRRLKQNIEPFTRGLYDILKLQTSSFEWNEKGRAITKAKEGQRFYGFVAQDLQAAIPEAVGEEGEYMTVKSHLAITAALVNAVKELKAEIDKIKE